MLEKKATLGIEETEDILIMLNHKKNSLQTKKQAEITQIKAETEKNVLELESQMMLIKSKIDNIKAETDEKLTIVNVKFVNEEKELEQRIKQWEVLQNEAKRRRAKKRK